MGDVGGPQLALLLRSDLAAAGVATLALFACLVAFDEEAALAALASQRGTSASH